MRTLIRLGKHLAQTWRALSGQNLSTIEHFKLNFRPHSLDQPEILYISGCPGASRQYRVAHFQNAIHKKNPPLLLEDNQLRGVPPCWHDLPIKAVIWHRARLNKWTRPHFDRFKSLKIPQIYDCDDPIFDKASVDSHPEVKKLLSHSLISENAALLRAVDLVSCSTPTLASIARENGAKKTVVLRNFVPANVFKSRKSQPQKFVIGIASGTATHAHDTALVHEPLRHVLRQVPNVTIKTLGPTKLNLSHKAESASLLKPWDEYLQWLAELDLLIVPLVKHRFNSAKSAVKWLEASSVGTPVLASAVGDYTSIVQHGSTGLLTENDQWYPALFGALQDPAKLREIAANANKIVTSECQAPKQTSMLLAAIDSLTIELNPDKK